MPWLREYARRKRARHFLERIPKGHAILEVGCATGWVGDYLRRHGWNSYTGIDLQPPADIVGDILQWRRLGLQPASFDTIIAFEVVEHVDCFQACYDLLRPGGRLLITTPVPAMDWLLYLCERLGLNQKRTSPHDHLVNLARVPVFEHKDIRTIHFVCQWATFTKEPQ